jgi:hypothetical protein
MVNQKALFIDISDESFRTAVQTGVSGRGNISVVSDLASSTVVITDKPGDYVKGEALRGKKLIVIAPTHVKAHPLAIRIMPGPRAPANALTKL